MAKTIPLNDLQLVLLSHAAKNDKGSIHPLPDAARRDEARTAKELSALVRRRLVEEVEVTGRSQSWRSDGDCSFGLVLTAAGSKALGLEAEQDKTPAPRREGSKIGAVIALLERADGATLGEMVSTTGWQPHTARAVLTGLRKKGHVIEKTKRGDVTCYRIVEPA